MYAKMFDEIDKKILFSVSVNNGGKTKYRVSQDTGIPYPKLEYRMKILKNNEFLISKKVKNKNKEVEIFTASDKIINFDNFLILIVDKNNLFIGSANNLIFKNIKMEIKNQKIKLTSDYSS